MKANGIFAVLGVASVIGFLGAGCAEPQKQVVYVPTYSPQPPYAGAQPVYTYTNQNVYQPPSGTVTEPAPEVTPSAPPVAITPAVPAPNAVTAAPTAPPAPYAENIPPSPGPDYCWVPGRWVWNNNVWVWESGNYMFRPGAGMTWVPGQWVWNHHWHGYVWIPGHWR